MTDIIQLLPDNIANQIAAGEVIQRPGSAVKELLENAVDAGATVIKLIVQDAGKALIQVIDNGKGMTELDARMCFERHATSKITNIDDLFRIKTMGFRGEALASIAAVAQVELKTRKKGEELGTYIEIDNSVVRVQEHCTCNEGTSIAMKNLFFNVPARRNFLKTNTAELRHIIDEFIRVSLAFPNIFFSLTNNGQEQFHLEKGSLKNRIIQILGNNYATKLVNVEEETDYLKIAGFVGKPDTAKKTRGDQYFFVNNRFIRSAYLNHAIMNAYQELIAPDSFPMYVIFIDLDPSYLDINVHPTKQEIKFEDEKIVYAFVQSAVKHALAQYSITPALDFDLDASIQHTDAVAKPFTQEKQESATFTSLFNTFTHKNQAHLISGNAGGYSGNGGGYSREAAKSSFEFFNPANRTFEAPVTQQVEAFETNTTTLKSGLQLLPDKIPAQIHSTFIIAETNRGFIVIHQQLAHERVLYEQLSKAMNGSAIATQQSLFPTTLDLNATDAVLLEELLPDLLIAGYMLEPFVKNCFIIRGTPAGIEHGNEILTIEKILEQYKHFSNEYNFPQREKLIRSLVAQQSIKSGKILTPFEMQQLTEQLFATTQPNSAPNGAPVYLEFKNDYLLDMFHQ